MYGIPADIDWSFLLGRDLQQVRVGLYDLQLHFHDGASISVTSSCSTRIEEAVVDWKDGSTSGAEAVLSFLGQKAVKVSTTEKSLTLEFERGGSWTVFDNDDRYETCTIESPDGVIVI